MDLKFAKTAGKWSLGTSVNNSYAHGFLHVDNICILASIISTLKWQFVEDECGEVQRVFSQMTGQALL